LTSDLSTSDVCHDLRWLHHRKSNDNTIDYASPQRKPTKYLVGLGLVVVLHLLLLWAINSGLARSSVKKLKGPV